MEQNLTLSIVVCDPALQVREALDESWIVELADLYRGNHDIEAIEVVYDGTRYLLTDGWHRIEAQRRAWGADALIAVSVIDASTTDDPMAIAKTRAAMSNRQGGLRRTDGDKKRAVLLLRSTAAGQKMKHEEIAKRVGVSRSWVTRILDGAEVSDVRANTTSIVNYGGATKAAVAALWLQIDAALKADPGKPDAHHARDLGCEDATVRRRRAVLDLPKSDPKRRKSSDGRDAVKADLAASPNARTTELAKRHGVSTKTVADVREEMGLPPAPRGGAAAHQEQPPSAPVNPRRTDDPREQGAEIMPARPAKRSDFATETLQRFERVDRIDRQAAIHVVYKRWPELIRNVLDEERESSEMVLN